MRVVKVRSQLASALALLSLLTGTCAERDGMLGRLLRQRSFLEQEEPQGSQRGPSSMLTDASINTLLSAVDDRSSRSRSHSITKTATTGKHLSALWLPIYICDYC